MMRDLDLKKMPLLDALNLAVSLSGKTRDEIGAEMGWSQFNSNRIFACESYWPTLPNLPRLCVACGNTVLLDWLFVQVEAGGLVFDSAPVDCEGLIFDIGALFGEMGDVAKAGQSAVADGKIGRNEARQLIRKLMDVMNTCFKLTGSLRAVGKAE